MRRVQDFRGFNERHLVYQLANLSAVQATKICNISSRAFNQKLNRSGIDCSGSGNDVHFPQKLSALLD
ncbi:hypothetical protein AD953_11670 [Acetobacter malorum]|uniref:Uncharacterized protein n=1 Tax=Acetobacter malorum TaxID=178901 RepID=A0A149V2N4_9PROT|nr:hypothetical protein AD953_11670 [Acetobacter malorum]